MDNTAKQQKGLSVVKGEKQEVMDIQTGQIDLANLSTGQLDLIKRTVAKNSSNDELSMFLHLAQKYGLDPFAKQIWFTKYGEEAQIFAGRDGFLEIAHRSGKFDGMESGVRKEGNETIGFAKVYRTDMKHPFCVEVYLSEYNTQRSLWKSKPKTMIKKVAESQALRQAFSISGLYSPEEIDEDDLKDQGKKQEYEKLKQEMKGEHESPTNTDTQPKEDHSQEATQQETQQENTQGIDKSSAVDVEVIEDVSPYKEVTIIQIKKGEKRGKPFLKVATSDNQTYFITNETDVETIVENVDPTEINTTVKCIVLEIQGSYVMSDIEIIG